LEGAEESAKSGVPLNWDIVSKAAHLHYYRIYAASRGEEKEKQADLAITWLLRALMINPHHVDFTAKYADVLGILKYYSDTVKLLEELFASPDAPAYIQQWLGYFLLYVDREKEAIQLSENYHDRFPNEDSAVFNAACGYAQLYEKDLKEKGIDEDKTSSNRRCALDRLREALKLEPTFATTVAEKWVESDESFYSLRNDSEFHQIVGLQSVVSNTQ